MNFKFILKLFRRTELSNIVIEHNRVAACKIIMLELRSPEEISEQKKGCCGKSALLHLFHQSRKQYYHLEMLFVVPIVEITAKAVF